MNLIVRPEERTSRIVSSRAVSYTHLDVYKRQGPPRPHGTRPGARPDRAGHGLGTLRNNETAALPRHGESENYVRRNPPPLRVGDLLRVGLDPRPPRAARNVLRLRHRVGSVHRAAHRPGAVSYTHLLPVARAVGVGEFDPPSPIPPSWNTTKDPIPRRATTSTPMMLPAMRRDERGLRAVVCDCSRRSPPETGPPPCIDASTGRD